MSENESTEATPTPTTDEQEVAQTSDAGNGLKDPDTTGAEASPEAGVTQGELTEDEKDREIRYS